MAEGTRTQVQALTQKGHTVLEIAHTLQVSPQAVYKHLKALGMKPGGSK